MMTIDIYNRQLTLGAFYLGEGRCRFRVWAPQVERVSVQLQGDKPRLVDLERRRRGYHMAVVEGVKLGDLYTYLLDGEIEHPDPVSRYQPRGVEGPSRVVDWEFNWNDDHWFGLPLQDYLIYELHVGTFTADGTFGGILPYLSRLCDLGVTALELMPVAQFPGTRSWGYNTAFPFAVQHSYGGPTGLKRLVDACHVRGLAVILDLNYSRPGPPLGYLNDYGPYLTVAPDAATDAAFNFDAAYSDEVRRYFIENALHWLMEYHVDALRLADLDAVTDHSARPFLEELTETVKHLSERLNRRIYLFAHSDCNDSRLIRARQLGGIGIDAGWSPDFHRALHSLLTGEMTGWYRDYGRLWYLARGFSEGFVYTGQHSQFYNRRRGNSAVNLHAKRFVVYSQSHLELGVRPRGERLARLQRAEAVRLAAGAVLLSPFIPLLFMGEEYGETAPFRYFTNVESAGVGGDPFRELMAAFRWEDEPEDPASPEAFEASRLNHKLAGQKAHRALFLYYKELIRLRGEIPALKTLTKEDIEVHGWEKEKVLFLRRWAEGSEVFAAFNFSDDEAPVALPVPTGTWHKRLDSAEERWGGAGSSVPEVIHSVGEAAMTLPRRTLVLFELEERV